MVYTAILLLEIIIKLLGLGLKLYFKDRFNMFDFGIIMVGLTDIAIEQTHLKEKY